MNVHGKDLELRNLKAQCVFLGIRQLEISEDLGISRTRLNRLFNGWIDATKEEKEKIKKYVESRRGRDGYWASPGKTSDHEVDPTKQG